jgi:addiction module HigA family antidote
VLAEELAERRMTQRELADGIRRPAKLVNEVINGKKAITADTALDLEQTLGITAQSWLNLQTAYDLTLARQKRLLRSA